MSLTRNQLTLVLPLHSPPTFFLKLQFVFSKAEQNTDTLLGSGSFARSLPVTTNGNWSCDVMSLTSNFTTPRVCTCLNDKCETVFTHWLNVVKRHIPLSSERVLQRPSHVDRSRVTSSLITVYNSDRQHKQFFCAII